MKYPHADFAIGSESSSRAQVCSYNSHSKTSLRRLSPYEILADHPACKTQSPHDARRSSLACLPPGIFTHVSSWNQHTEPNTRPEVPTPPPPTPPVVVYAHTEFAISEILDSNSNNPTPSLPAAINLVHWTVTSSPMKKLLWILPPSLTNGVQTRKRFPQAYQPTRPLSRSFF